RERELVRLDLVNGKITMTAARASYGYEPAVGEGVAVSNSAGIRAAAGSPRIVVTAESLAPAAVKLLADRGARVRYLPTNASIAMLIDAVAEAPTDAIVSRAMPLSADVMDAARALKVISKYGVGVDNIDLRAAVARGIVVMRAYGTNARSVAELAL